MRSDPLLLQDILDAIAVIGQYLPANRAAFDSDPPLQSHIYRHIMIIGEAACRLSKGLKDKSQQIPWKSIEGMRHILVHHYFKIDWDEVYSTAIHDIPALKALIQSLVSSLAPDEP